MDETSFVKGVIFIPTFNEIENIQKLIHQLDCLQLGFDFLFIDDNSPDGTGELLDLLAESMPNLFVIHRSQKLGIGSAHIDGIHWAYDNGYQILISMDSDFSHSPSYIYDLLTHFESADVVLGSRFIQKNSLIEWNVIRKFLTNMGHFFTKTFLQMPFDSTGAFRLYRLDHINKHLFSTISSGGYAFFFESLFILFQNNYIIKEIPIDLPARTYGQSKMTINDAMKSFFMLWSIVLKRTLFTDNQNILVKKESKGQNE